MVVIFVSQAETTEVSHVAYLKKEIVEIGVTLLRKFVPEARMAHVGKLEPVLRSAVDKA